jgi:hypothetical protein
MVAIVKIYSNEIKNKVRAWSMKKYPDRERERVEARIAMK